MDFWPLKDRVQKMIHATSWLTCDTLRDYVLWYTNNLICRAKKTSKVHTNMKDEARILHK